jgi:hypothetical protein
MVGMLEEGVKANLILCQLRKKANNYFCEIWIYDKNAAMFCAMADPFNSSKNYVILRIK